MKIFFEGIKQIWNDLCVISLKASTKKVKTSKFHRDANTSFCRLCCAVDIRYLEPPRDH